MKRFRCGDVVPGCTAAFQGTEDEILQAVGAHASAEHGMTEVSESTVVAVRNLMELVAA
jgi:predicted small metal-binding protein